MRRIQNLQKYPGCKATQRSASSQSKIHKILMNKFVYVVIVIVDILNG